MKKILNKNQLKKLFFGETIHPLILRIEPVFFIGLCIFHLLPIFLNQYFLTGDGPAHLYNVALLSELLNNNSFLKDFYQLNSSISPNIIGHLFLLLIGKVSSYLFAEKCIVIFYLLGLPLSFRYYLNKQFPKNKILSYFIFPFTYSFLFMYGFYNFHIGLVFLFLTLGLWDRYYSGPVTVKGTVLLIFLSLVIYFSHLFIFLLFVFVIILKNIVFSTSSRNRLIQGFILMPGVVLSAIFLFNKISPTVNFDFFSYSELSQMITGIQPVKAMRYGKESKFILLLQLGFLILISFGIYQYFQKRKVAFDLHLWISILLLVALFLVPNSSSNGIGLVSFRIALFFFLFFILSFTKVYLPPVVQFVVLVLVTYASVAFLKIYFKEIKANHQLVTQIMKLEKSIPENSVILPVYLMDHPLVGHSSNYLGIHKSNIILDNYEAELTDFPLKWSYQELPSFHLGNIPLSRINCFQYPTNKDNSVKEVDYIFLLREEEYQLDDCKKEFMREMQEHFTRIQVEGELVELWKSD